jgi:hypothetical protein
MRLRKLMQIIVSGRYDQNTWYRVCRKQREDWHTADYSLY